MTEQKDADWMIGVREALEHETKTTASAPSRLRDEDRDAIAKSALDALAGVRRLPKPKPKPNVARLWYALPAIAIAATLFLFLRRPPSDDTFGAYRPELVGVEATRGPAAPATSTLTVAPGFPFAIVLRPAAEGSDPVHYATTFVRAKDGVRAAALNVEIAPSGAVRVSGDGAALADADEVLVVLTKREASADALRAALADAKASEPEYTIPASNAHPTAKVFTVKLDRR